MTPLRTAALVVLFTLAALSAVGTCVESYWTCLGKVESVFDFTLPALRTEAG
jgi:hypothetical protein